jgi:hypothetical protein
VRGDISRSGAQQPSVERQRPRHHGTVLRHAETDGQVQVILHQVGHGVSQNQRQRDLRMQAVEFLQPPLQHVTPEVRGGGDTQLAADRAAASLQGRLGIVQRVQGLLAMRQVHGALGGESQAPRGAFEQAGVQRRLQLHQARWKRPATAPSCGPPQKGCPSWPLRRRDGYLPGFGSSLFCFF